jgi:ABC-type antimicrobial peptide transport system permease subunit
VATGVAEFVLQQAGYGGHHVVLRTAGPVEPLEPALRQAVADVSRDLPVPLITSQTAHMRAMTIRERVFAQLLSLFGIFALLLACIGLHGVTSYSVARRTSEIGVRMALGATSSQVLWMVLRQVAMLAAVGLVVGADATDPAVLAAGALLMLVVALAAGWFPAWRAARLDPLKALRAE